MSDRRSRERETHSLTSALEQRLDADRRAERITGDALIDAVVVRLKLQHLYRHRTSTWPLTDTWLRIHVQLSAVLCPPVPVVHVTSRHQRPRASIQSNPM